MSEGPENMSTFSAQAKTYHISQLRSSNDLEYHIDELKPRHAGVNFEKGSLG